MRHLSNKLPWDLAQPKWAAALNPILAIPMLQGLQIDNIVLASGVANSLNHLLGRTPQGWFLVDQNAAGSVFRSASFNQYTLSLTADADMIVAIWVY